MKQLLEYPLEDGGTIWVEVAQPERGGLVPAARPGEVVARAQQTLEDALSRLKPMAKAIVHQFDELAPDEVEVEFGVKLSAEAGAILAAAGAEANYNIKLVWKSNRSA